MSNKSLPNITVLYEDADCAVINKPSGLMVHPDGRAEGPFLTDWVVEKYPQAAAVGEPARGQDGSDLNRAGIVHRLDRETSGALIIAKTAEAHAALKAQFQDRTVDKKYLAFVWGDMEEEFGTIDRPIGRSGSDFRKWSAQRGARGDLRDAETYWTMMGKGRAKDSDGMESTFTLLHAEPKTGRTHQIRVHFTAIQHPVVGDSLYAPKRAAALGFTRTALHSYSVEFDNLQGKRVKVIAPLPEDFLNACNEVGIDPSKLKI